MTDAITEHTQAMLRAFAEVLAAEERARAAKCELDEHTARLKAEINAAELAEADAWSRVAALMAETGEVEVTLPGAATDYRIHHSPARESVKVDADAVPDEFCKVERKPKLTEIGKHLKSLQAVGATLPNWASLERSVPRLCWKAVKKGVA